MPKFRRYLTAFALLVAVLLLGSRAEAGICLLPCACTVVANPLTFGMYSPAMASPLKVTSGSTVSCSGGLVGLLFNIVVSLSTGNSGTFAQRRMTGPGNAPLGYNVYTDPGDNTVFGDGTGGSQTLGYAILLAVGGFNQPVTYYGEIPASYSAPSGTFLDSLTMTVNY